MGKKSIKLTRKGSEYVTKPILYLEINNPLGSGEKRNKSIPALIDTGADVSFLMKGTHTFTDQDFLRNGNYVFRIYFSIDGLVENTRFNFGEREFRNHNPNDIQPQVLLGRDFLKNVKLCYDGINDIIDIEWP